LVRILRTNDRGFVESKGCGFVHFQNPDKAQDAIERLSGKYILPGSDKPIFVTAAGTNGPKKFYRGFRAYVDEINPKSSEDDVKQLFSPYGEILGVQFLKKSYKYSR